MSLVHSMPDTTGAATGAATVAADSSLLNTSIITLVLEPVAGLTYLLMA